MEIDLVQVATNLVVAALSAWLGGKFGVRHGLEQAKRERAFDRRLDGYEKAFRVMSRFRSSIADFVLGFHLRDLSEHGKLLEALEKSAAEAEICAHEAALFAERVVIKKLADLRLALVKIILAVKDINPPDIEEERELVKKVSELARTMREITLTMAQRVRGHLGLDEITAEDLASETGSKQKKGQDR